MNKRSFVMFFSQRGYVIDELDGGGVIAYRGRVGIVANFRKGKHPDLAGWRRIDGAWCPEHFQFRDYRDANKWAGGVRK